MTTKVITDGIKVTPDEALELMTHHLLLATRFFEAVSNDMDRNRSELQRILGDETICLGAAMVWLDAVDKAYKELG